MTSFSISKLAITIALLIFITSCKGTDEQTFDGDNRDMYADPRSNQTEDYSEEKVVLDDDSLNVYQTEESHLND